MDMHNLLKSSMYLEMSQVRTIMYDILCALKYLHGCKVLHRDLKPANILINEDCSAQVCDFDLARSVAGLTKFVDGEPEEEKKEEKPIEGRASLAGPADKG